MQTYSLDLRQRIVAAVDQRVGTQQAVADVFGVSRRTLKKLLRQRCEQGTVAPRPHGGGYPAKLSPADRVAIARYVRTHPDAILTEIQHYVAQRRSVTVSRATIGRVVQSLNLPRKKRWWPANVIRTNALRFVSTSPHTPVHTSSLLTKPVSTAIMGLTFL